LPQQLNPSEKAAATSTDLKSLFIQPAPRRCLGELLQPRHPLCSRRPPRTEITEDRTLIKSTETLGSAIWGSAALRQIGRKSVASRPRGPSLSEARKPSFDHSLGLARFRSCSHQPPSTRARDLSGCPVLVSSWDCLLLLVSLVSLVSSTGTTEKLQSLEARRPHHRTCTLPFPSPILLPPKILPCIPVHKVICTLPLALEQHPPPRARYLTSPHHDKSKLAAACC
jgi:hypothetical protein